VARVPYQRRDEEWQVLLRRVLDLAPGDRLKVYAGLRDDLGSVLGKELERERQARLRHEAREATRVAAQVLELPDNQAPKVAEYKEAAQRAELPMSFNAVYEAFESRWDLAQRFYRGEDIPASAAQRAARRGNLGSARGRFEDPIAGVREFLSQDPPPASTTRADYNAWAREANEHRPASEPRLLEHGDHIRTVLRTSWERAKAVARGEKTLADARAERLADQLAESGPLVGHIVGASLLEMSPQTFEKYRGRTGFPRPVAIVGRRPLWRRSDLEAWRDGKRRDFGAEEGELQDAVVGAAEIAALTGMSVELLRSRVAEERWDTVPRPAGTTAMRLYWMRDEVERWARER